MQFQPFSGHSGSVLQESHGQMDRINLPNHNNKRRPPPSPSSFFPPFWAFARLSLCYDMNKVQLNMLALLFGSKRDK